MKAKVNSFVWDEYRALKIIFQFDSTFSLLCECEWACLDRSAWSNHLIAFYYQETRVNPWHGDDDDDDQQQKMLRVRILRGPVTHACALGSRATFLLVVVHSSREEIYTRSTFLMVIKRVHSTADDSKKCIDMSCIMRYNVDMDVCPRERIKRSSAIAVRVRNEWARWQGEQMKGEKEKKKKKILCRVYYNHVVTQSETSSNHPARYNIYCSTVYGTRVCRL